MLFVIVIKMSIVYTLALFFHHLHHLHQKWSTIGLLLHSNKDNNRSLAYVHTI